MGSKGRFAVMRLPCLMEDEGRTFLERVCNTKEEAEEYIKGLIERYHYFSRGDYAIYETTEET